MNDELTERQWARLLPLLPLQRPSRGRPAKDHRTTVNAILPICAPWRICPPTQGDTGGPSPVASTAGPPRVASGRYSLSYSEMRTRRERSTVPSTLSTVARYALTSTPQVLEVAAEKTRRLVETAEALPARFMSKSKGTTSS
jgi:hypothetical protein